MALFPTVKHWQKYKWIRGLLNETNDCSVVAMAQSTGRTYQDCHAACKKYGRPHRKGFAYIYYIQAFNSLGFQLKNIKFKASVIRLVMLELERDRPYMIWVGNHYSCFLNGVWMDHTSLNNRRVKFVFEVIAAA